ncbi:hypothetical protein ACFQXA_05495 [Nocardiopsis composta]
MPGSRSQGRRARSGRIPSITAIGAQKLHTACPPMKATALAALRPSGAMSVGSVIADQ